MNGVNTKSVVGISFPLIIGLVHLCHVPLVERLIGQFFTVRSNKNYSWKTKILVKRKSNFFWVVNLSNEVGPRFRIRQCISINWDDLLQENTIRVIWYLKCIIELFLFYNYRFQDVYEWETILKYLTQSPI